MKYNIAVLCWGESLEREISLKSWKYIFESIDSQFDKKFFDFPKDKNDFIKKYKEFDLVIPVFHWVWGEDWRVFAFLEELWLKYLFSDFSTHNLCMDKYLALNFLNDFQVNTGSYFLIQNIEDFDNLILDWKYFVKPNKWWSSVYNWLFDDKNHSKELVEKILDFDDVLIQEFIRGEEFSVSLYWDYDRDIKVAWITQIFSENEFFDFDAKYNSKDTKEITPANIDKDLEKNLTNISKDIYKRLKLKTVWRIDFVINKTWIYFLEVNTIPGFTYSSIFPKALIYGWFESIKDFFTDQIKRL